MSNLVKALALLQETFDNYAGKDGDSNTLSKAEVSELLHKELHFGESVPKAEVDEFFKMLDSDNSGLVDFTEYVTLVVSLSMLIRGSTYSTTQ